jgi:drug/metabolite transporter (DMT)-like permease
MTRRRANLKAGALMLCAVLSFSLMDAGLKVLSGAYPPMQVAALRALASLPFVLVWITFAGGFRQLLRVRFGLHVMRGVLGIAMLAAFVQGVSHLPLATAYAIFFAAPLLITAFAPARRARGAAALDGHRGRARGRAGRLATGGVGDRHLARPRRCGTPR